MLFRVCRSKRRRHVRTEKAAAPSTHLQNTENQRPFAVLSQRGTWTNMKEACRLRPLQPNRGLPLPGAQCAASRGRNDVKELARFLVLLWRWLKPTRTQPVTLGWNFVHCGGSRFETREGPRGQPSVTVDHRCACLSERITLSRSGHSGLPAEPPSVTLAL